MKHAKETAASLGYSSILVQGDPNAARFYRRMGGVETGSMPSASIPGRQLPLFEITILPDATRRR